MVTCTTLAVTVSPMCVDLAVATWAQGSGERVMCADRLSARCARQRALYRGRRKVRPMAGSYNATTCPGLLPWRQRWTFRSVRRLQGGGIGNRCDTAPQAQHATISGNPTQGELPW